MDTPDKKWKSWFKIGLCFFIALICFIIFEVI